LGPGYIANDVEFHINIVSEHAGAVNAYKSPNAAVQGPRAALASDPVSRSTATPCYASPRRFLKPFGKSLARLYASRPAARGLLSNASAVQTAFGEVRVVSSEGLIGLKIQAFVNNPRRTQDLEDIRALIVANRQALNMEEVCEYFRLFNREALLEEIIKWAYLPMTDSRSWPMAVLLTCRRLPAVIHLQP
jgi:hypothetical protein